MWKRLHVKYLNFLDRFSKEKKTRISSVIKFRVVGAELFSEDGRTAGQADMTKLVVASRNFANAPKNMLRKLFFFLKTVHNTYIFSIGRTQNFLMFNLEIPTINTRVEESSTKTIFINLQTI